MKKQLKKGLSLIMAVLMVMSCWVWVAPTKAEAANESTAGKYTLAITAKVNNPADTAYVRVKAKKNNGTGEQNWISSDGSLSNDEVQITMSCYTSSEGTQTFTLSNIDGFPTFVDVCFKTDWNHTTKITLQSIAINGITVCSGEWTKSGNGSGIGGGNEGTWHRSFVPASASGGSATSGTVATDGDGTSGKSEGTWNWEFPKFTNNFSTTTPVNVTIPKMGESVNVSAAMPAFDYYDQYGVARYQGEGSYVLTTGAKASEDISDESVMYLNSTDKKVYVKDQMQITYPAPDSLYKDFYVNALGEDNKTVIASQLIRVNYPTYNYSFVSDYATNTGDEATTITLSDGQTVKTQVNAKGDNSNFIKAYGQKLSVWPTNAEKEGYDFLGFWTVAQPKETENKGASAYASNSEALTPVSSAVYEAMTDEQKANYYDAGTQWDAASKELKTCSGDVTYYAWFRAKDINIKFYTLKGEFIKEVYSKYGKLGNDIVFPTTGKDFPDSFTSGPFKYSQYNGRWDDISGATFDANTKLTKDSYILTPQYDTVEFDNQYSVKFYNGNLDNLATNRSDVKYRETVTSPKVNSTINSSDAEYSYTFEGWTTVDPGKGDKDNKRHIIEEDGYYSVTAETTISIVDSFVIRSDVEFYPVYRRHIKSYDVTFSYRNDLGELVTDTTTYEYGKYISAPKGVPSAWAKEGYEYAFSGWKATSGAKFDSTEIKNQRCIKNETYTAVYGSGVAKPYNVSFVSINDKGEEETTTFQVNHGAKLTQKDIDSLDSAKTYDDGEKLKSFQNMWEYNGKQYTAEELAGFSPTSHTTFKAVYDEGKPFYTVTYVDGTNEKTFRIVEGTALPQWTITTTETDKDGNETTKTEIYTPSRENTESGEYTFLCWSDKEQTADDLANGTVTGTKYDNTSKVEGDLTLYPQFTFKKFTYTYVFVDYKGNELNKVMVSYGDSLAEAAKEAAEEAESMGKPSDYTYNYKFLGWDKKVPTVCKDEEPGSTTTFTAQYKASYIYYDVEWYNSEEDMEKEDAKALAVGKYVYGSKIHTASDIKLTPPESDDESQSYVLDSWKYLDNDGNEQTYTRGLVLDMNNVKIEGNKIKMWATYKLTEKTHTVTVDVNGNKTVYVVAENSTIENLVSEPASGYVDEKKHNAFDKWVTKTTVDGEEVEKEFNLKTPITENITIYAKFTEDEHKYELNEVVVAPTYADKGYRVDENSEWLVKPTDGTGIRAYWCECDKERTYVKDPKVNEDCLIPALTDKVDPTGTAYVGTKFWSSIDEAEADDSEVYANPNTYFILTTTDKGGNDKNNDLVNKEFNPTFKGIGVAKIEIVFLESNGTSHDGDFDITEIDDDDWTTIYSWNEIQGQLIEYYGSWDNVPDMYKDYNANVTTMASDYNLEDGVAYRAYYKITDKARNIGYMRTGDFLYDATAPEVTVKGNGNKDTYCEMATIVVSGEIEGAFTVTDNGVIVEATCDKDTEECTYKVSTAGTHLIVVTDEAGNKTTKYFTVNAGHNTTEYTKEATCLEAGYTSKKCTVCGKDFDIVNIEAKGHEWQDTIVAATCKENGYIARTCKNCDNPEERQYYQTDENGEIIMDESKKDVEGYEGELLYPATGHTWNDGVVTKKVTCSTDGTTVYTCTSCGITKTETVKKDGKTHSYYKAVVNKVSCTEDGSRTQTCRLCGDVDTIETIPATGHANTEFVVTEEATCEKQGYKTKECSDCGETITDAQGNPITEIISQKAHKWVYDAENSKPATAEADGVYAYKCANCGKIYKETLAKLNTYTITFFDEDGTELEIINKVQGETIDESVVTEPTKNSSEDGRTGYKFDGWYTKKADGSYDKKYTLSMTATSDLKLYAKFKSYDIHYTAQFMVPTSGEKLNDTNSYVELISLMGGVGDERVPNVKPSLEGTDTESYEFTGWADGQANTYDGKIKEDKTYYAQFCIKKNTCDVIFMNGEVAYGKVQVEVGNEAKIDGTPTKASDKDFHYTFSGWYTAAIGGEKADLSKITKKTTVYAQYTAEAHTAKDKGTVKQAASCEKAEITTMTCSCGYSWDEVTSAALGHDLKDPVYNEATGMNDFCCSRCDYVKSEIASYTITFKNENGQYLSKINVKYNETFTSQAETIAAGATKADTDRYTYKFIGWRQDGVGDVIATKDLPAAKEAATYYAAYEESERTFTVTFANADNEPVVSFSGIKYGTVTDKNGNDITKYAWSAELFPVPESNANGHYIYLKWDNDFSGGVKTNILVRPVYQQIAHNYLPGVESDATCETAGGIKHECKDCGYFYIDGNVPAKGHNWVEKIDVEATFTSKGSGTKTCQNCGKIEKFEIPMKEYITFTVTVKDTNGKVFEGAKVTVEHMVSGKKYGPNLTDKNGVATFKVEEAGEYFVAIVDIAGHEGGTQGYITVDESGKITNNTIKDVTGETHTDCSCGCHRNGFWGMIFRFFHKIIKLFAGRYVCCDCPDSRY